MRITEVRVKLMEDPDDRLQAFCSVTFDDAFVVRDLKIIAGATSPFVAMPSRKLTSHCGRCGCKNHMRAAYCNQCGTRQNYNGSSTNKEGRPKLYADIAHPINSACREMIQNAVVRAFEEEKKLAAQPDYVSRYDDSMDYDNPAPRKADPGTEPGEMPSKDNPSKTTHTNRRTDEPAKAAKSQRPQREKKPNPVHGSTDGDFGDGVF